MSERLYRANWKLTGLLGQTLAPGDTIRLTPEMAAPYLGSVLSPADEVEEAAAAPVDTGDQPADAEPAATAEETTAAPVDTGDQPRRARGRR